MNEIYKAIEHFEHLQKRYTTQHNGKHCELVKTALAALREQAERNGLILCGQCSHWANGTTAKRPCNKTGAYPMAYNDFCSKGKRLEVEQDA